MRKVLFILSELADADIDWLIENGTRETHPSGTILIHEGKPIEVLYIVLSGRLAVSLAHRTPPRSASPRMPGTR